MTKVKQSLNKNLFELFVDAFESLAFHLELLVGKLFGMQLLDMLDGSLKDRSFLVENVAVIKFISKI